MKINSVFVEQHGSGQNVIVSFHLPGEVELDETDVARLVDVAREAAGAAEEAAEAPKRGRGRPAAKAEADDDTAAEPPKRGRGRPRKEAEETPAAEPAEEKPSLRRRRRRGAAAAEEEEGITDADLVKAVSEAAEVLGQDAVKELLSDFKVKVVADIAQEEREEFLALLNDNITDAAK